MKQNLITLFMLALLVASCKTETKKGITTNIETTENVEIIPVYHATMVLNYKNETLYVDPTGGKEAFANHKKPTIVLITDLHGDHLKISTLEALNLTNTTLIAPKTVIDKLPENIAKHTIILYNGNILTNQNNGGTIVSKDLTIEAIPMYNLPEVESSRHTKGRGNGYVITFGKQRVYISGDTEDIPEMRALKDIDIAFVCMNLPYTMTVENAANAVIDFKPKQVYPYHYKGKEGFSDVEKFKSIVNEGNTEIEVIQLEWYNKK